MPQPNEIKDKSPDALTHADVKSMIASNQHEWLLEHQAMLPRLVLVELDQHQLPHITIEAWNNNPVVKRHLAMLEWYAAAYSVDIKEERVIDQAECLAVLDACFGGEIYARKNNDVIVMALLSDILSFVKASCQKTYYTNSGNRGAFAPFWARQKMAYDVLLKTGNVFLDDQLTDDEIKQILTVMAKISEYYQFKSENEKKYLASLLETPISDVMRGRIAVFGKVSDGADQEASDDRPLMKISRGFQCGLGWILDSNKEMADMLRAKFQSDQPYAFFELMLPVLAPLDMHGNFLEGSRLYHSFHQLLWYLKVDPAECTYGPYRCYLSDEFNSRLQGEKFQYFDRVVGFDEFAHDLAFFIENHAELKPENLQVFENELRFLEKNKHQTLAYALTLPGLPEAARCGLHPLLNTKESIERVFDLMCYYSDAFPQNRIYKLAPLKQLLINPNFSTDQTYALKLKKGESRVTVETMKSAKSMLFSLIENEQALAQAFFDKIVLGGGCLLLNMLMTNSKLTEVRYNTDTMKEKVIPLMKTYTLSPAAISTLMDRKDNLSLRDALMVLIFVTGEDEQSKTVRQKAFDCLNTKINKADINVLVEAMIFIRDEAKVNLVGYLYREGKAEKNHQRLLSELGLKPSFITIAITKFNQAGHDKQISMANNQGDKRHDKLFDL